MSVSVKANPHPTTFIHKASRCKHNVSADMEKEPTGGFQWHPSRVQLPLFCEPVKTPSILKESSWHRLYYVSLTLDIFLFVYC